MNKALRNIRILAAAFLSFIPLTSCSSFFSEGRTIESITTKVEENGDTTVTINYVDGYDSTTFTIPAGTDGEDGKTGPAGPVGNGIKDITTETDDNGITYLVIDFTDESMDPERFEVPSFVSIDDVTSSYDIGKETNTITIHLSDGSEKSFVVQDGKDGVGIKDITTETDEEGNTTIHISYTDPDRPDTSIQIPYISGKDGKDGKGIASIYTDSDGENYYLYITYTDDPDGENTEVLTFPMPESTKWLQGNGAPGFEAGAQAKKGDFYYDLTNYAIYSYNGFSWDLIASLKSENITCTVEFDATTNGGILDGTYLPTVTCQKGECLDYTQIPTASKDGYRFIGWYSSALGPSDPKAGKFTDLTPVTKVYLTLFACFEEI